MPKPPITKPNTPKPDRAGDTRREGKKSVNWRDDPEILERLVKVAQLMNQNVRDWQIARETKTSIATAKLDKSRVRELWKEDARDQIKSAKDIALAQYGEVIRQAWEDLAQIKSRNNPARAAALNVIIRAQREKDKVGGIAEKHEHTGPDGGPIQHSVADMEKIRNKRWQGVAPQLGKITQEDTNGGKSGTQSKKPN